MQLSKGWTTAKIKKRIAHLEELGKLTAETAEDLKIHKQILRQIEGNGSVRYRLVHGDIVDGNMVLKQFDASQTGAKAVKFDKTKPTSTIKAPLADADNVALTKFQRKCKADLFESIEQSMPDKQTARKLVNDLKAGRIRNTSKLNKAHRELLEGVFETFNATRPRGIIGRGIDATKGGIRRTAGLAQNGGRKVAKYIAGIKGGKHILRIAGKGSTIIVEGGKILFIAADFAFIAWETKHDIEQYLAGNYNTTMVVAKSTLRSGELAYAITILFYDPTGWGAVIAIAGGGALVAIDMGLDYYNESRLARQKKLLEEITVDQRFRATSRKLKARINSIGSNKKIAFELRVDMAA
jgi:hypothetical protein